MLPPSLENRIRKRAEIVSLDDVGDPGAKIVDRLRIDIDAEDKTILGLSVGHDRSGPKDVLRRGKSLPDAEALIGLRAEIWRASGQAAARRIGAVGTAAVKPAHVVPRSGAGVEGAAACGPSHDRICPL